MRKIGPSFLFVSMERSGKDHKTGYLFLVILRDVAEELAGLPEQDILLAKLFLQELLRHKSYRRIRPQPEERGLLSASVISTSQMLLTLALAALTLTLMLVLVAPARSSIRGARPGIS